MAEENDTQKPSREAVDPVSDCSPLERLKDAIEAGKLAHRETHKEHLCWRRLMDLEHEAIACAVVAHVLDIPASFVHGVLDLQMGRVEEMEND